MGLVWIIIYHFQVHELMKLRSGVNEKINAEKELLQWCTDRLEKYDLPNQPADFRPATWADGYGMNGLIHSSGNNPFDFSSLEEMSDPERLQHAFAMANKLLGVPCLLDVQDFESGSVDRRSLILYISSLYEQMQISEASSVLNECTALNSAMSEEEKFIQTTKETDFLNPGDNNKDISAEDMPAFYESYEAFFMDLDVHVESIEEIRLGVENMLSSQMAAIEEVRALEDNFLKLVENWDQMFIVAKESHLRTQEKFLKIIEEKHQACSKVLSDVNEILQATKLDDVTEPEALTELAQKMELLNNMLAEWIPSKDWVGSNLLRLAQDQSLAEDAQVGCKRKADDLSKNFLQIQEKLQESQKAMVKKQGDLTTSREAWFADLAELTKWIADRRAYLESIELPNAGDMVDGADGVQFYDENLLDEIETAHVNTSDQLKVLQGEMADRGTSIGILLEKFADILQYDDEAKERMAKLNSEFSNLRSNAQDILNAITSDIDRIVQERETLKQRWLAQVTAVQDWVQQSQQTIDDMKELSFDDTKEKHAAQVKMLQYSEVS
jgi:hypothetical protein